MNRISIESNLQRSRILNDFQTITGLTIDDAIQFLDQYDWNLTKIIDDFYQGIDIQNHRQIENPDLGRFYSSEPLRENINENEEQYYKELLKFFENENENKEIQKISSSPKGNDAPAIYHERQRLQRCGLHSLNNLFQIPKLFTPKYLENIVKQFDKRILFNDYRTIWLGNYDLRILIEAIHREGFDVKQINIQSDQSLFDLPWNSYFGLLINLNRNHWFTIRNLYGIYYNLDSTFRKPLQIGNETNLIDYLIRLIRQTNEFYLFVVLENKK